MKEFKGVTVIIKKGSAKEKFFAWYELTPAMCVRLRRFVKESINPSYGVVVIGRNEDFKPREHDNVVCDNIIHMLQKIKDCVLYKEVEKEFLKIIEVPITYVLPLDPTVFSVITGTFGSSGFAFAEIKSEKKTIKCDLVELQKELSEEGFNAGISTTNCIFLRQGDIELDDNGKLIFTAKTKRDVITTDKVKVKA